MKLLKKIIWALTWRRKLCPFCENLKCISNFSPCYQCRQGSEYEEARHDQWENY